MGCFIQKPKKNLVKAILCFHENYSKRVWLYDVNSQDWLDGSYSFLSQILRNRINHMFLISKFFHWKFSMKIPFTTCRRWFCHPTFRNLFFVWYNNTEEFWFSLCLTQFECERMRSDETLLDFFHMKENSEELFRFVSNVITQYTGVEQLLTSD